MNNKARTIQLPLEQWESDQWEIPIQSKPIVSMGQVRVIQSVTCCQEPELTRAAQSSGLRTPPPSRHRLGRRLISKTRLPQAILAGKP